MVKIKGFTLIELMIVIAIVGILASMVSGAVRCYNERNDTTPSTDSSSEMVINGVVHICDDFGACEPKD